jgi:DNA repair exonuclease SbcCD ATPase subunit
MVGIVKDIEDTVRELETDHAAWTLLRDLMSPQKGWIAKQMSGFVEHLVEQMNLIIARIWEYDLKVKPCSIETGKLDYKFPLHFHKDGKSGQTKDISEGSTGQKDVVDFAFMLVVMLYKDLQDYPMFLDETGASFDPVHRTRLMNFINQHLDNQRCSQVYLVSHYATFSGGLSNADICVLDKTNISVPDEYNVGVTIN